MNKYTNPFFTIDEAMSTLKFLGADPMRDVPAGQFDWRKQIMSIYVNPIYNVSSGHYYGINIHMEDSGFDELVRLTQSNDKVTKEVFSFEFDQYTFEPGEGLRIYKLTPREDVQ